MKKLFRWIALSLALACFVVAGPASAMSEDEFVARLQVSTTATNDGASQTEATCTASCGSGPSVSTSGCTGSCTAQDRDCTTNQRGYVQCGSGPKTFCSQQCSTPTCKATTPCPGGTVLTCTGSGFDCIGGEGLCFVSCNGVAQFCPGHQGAIFCDAFREPAEFGPYR